MGKSGSGSGMNNLDHISESLETVFWVTKLEKFGSGILDKHSGSATLLNSDKFPNYESPNSIEPTTL